MFYEISKKASMRVKERFMTYVVTSVYILYLSCLQKCQREEVLSKELLCQEQKHKPACLCVFIWIII